MGPKRRENTSAAVLRSKVDRMSSKTRNGDRVKRARANASRRVSNMSLEEQELHAQLAVFAHH